MSAFYGVPLQRSAPLRLAAHPESPTAEGWREWVASQTRPIAVDLFAGAGGLTLGLETAGYRVALAVDVNPWALETHRHNFPGLALDLNLGDPVARNTLVTMLDGLEVDLVAGGPPCQPYSRAGRSKIRNLVSLGTRHAVDHRRELWRAFLDVVVRVRPKSVLMENVPDMALGDDMSVLRSMMSTLEAAGYEVDASLVNAPDFGVPQHRQRLILVGLRQGGVFSWPTRSQQQIDLRQAIGDLPSIDSAAGDTGQVETAYGGPRSDFQKRARVRCTGAHEGIVFDHVTRPVRADDIEAFNQMTPTTRYSALPDELKRYRDDIFDDKYKRLGWSELSRSITAHIAKDGYWYIHPSDPRTLTVREAARIQTFPDDFRFAGSRSHQFAQIGNAVPPALGAIIGSALLAAQRSPQVDATTRLSSKRQQVRLVLDAWASNDATTTPWAYSSVPWEALVGVIIGERAGCWPTPELVLQRMPTFGRATRERLRVLAVMSDPGRSRAAVERLAAVVEAIRADEKGWAGTSWRALLRPAERSWVTSLAIDRTKMTASTAALRVVARLTGSEVDRQRRLSDGRMELAKLIGDDANAPRRNGALHRIGTAICLSDAPRCSACPLANACVAMRKAG